MPLLIYQANASVLLWYYTYVKGVANIAEATQAIAFTLPETIIAHMLSMTQASVDGDKLNDKEQVKSLIPGDPTQLARNMPQA